VTAPVLRGARFALDAARPAVARLDTSRGPEDLAADLIETWSAVEAALRSLVGSTTLSGQPLIREARGRQMINFDQANALAEFQAVHDRVQSTTYHPTDADINAARSAFLKLDSALLGDSGAEPLRPAHGVSPRAAPQVVTTTPIVAETPPPTQSMLVAPPPRFPLWMLAALGILVVTVIAVGGYFIFGHRGTSSVQQGVDAYTRGQREVAVNAFNKAVRDDAKDPLPHIYLARMAREVGNFSLASQELQLALQADPNNALALREMGADLLAQGNYELARRFYIRAVQADPTDKSAQGYLGCTLMRLGRVPEATTFLNRGGPGPWTGCTPVANPNAQNAIPGQSPLRAQPLTNNPRP
jgi:tetratricopeptide (TPR) repeat protein